MKTSDSGRKSHVARVKKLTRGERTRICDQANGGLNVGRKKRESERGLNQRV